MDVKFYLKDPKKKGDTSIFCLCHFGYKEKTDKGTEFKPVKVYTKLKINPKYWNFKSQKTRGNYANSPEFNESLNTIKDELTKVYLTIKNNGQYVTPELFKKEWNNYNNPTPEPAKVEFIEFVEQFIERARGNRTNGTIQSYNSTLKHLKNFAKKKKIELTFDAINLDFFLDLQEYMKTELKFSTNTRWKVTKVLKTFMNESIERKYHNNIDFKSKRFTIKQELSETVYLNENELLTLWETDFSKNKKLERVRDLFLIGCYTGLRFSDLSRLTHNNIIEFEGEKMLNIRTQKTGEVVSIPLHYIVFEIIEKYGGKVPKSLSNQKFNDYLKEICRETGLTETTNIEKKEKPQENLTISKYYKKWELISTHTARRSFATNMYLAGFDPISIRKITGHRTEKSFLSYIRLSGKENALVMSKHDYFKKPLKIAE